MVLGLVPFRFQLPPVLALYTIIIHNVIPSFCLWYMLQALSEHVNKVVAKGMASYVVGFKFAFEQFIAVSDIGVCVAMVGAAQ